VIVAAAALGSAALAPEAAVPPGFEVVATGLPRPLQLALDRRTLVVLGAGPRGDSAGEIHRLDLDGPLPTDVTHRPRVQIPYRAERPATLGSLAREPTTHDLFLGEENGSRVYLLDREERLTLYVDGLRRLGGGSTVAFDGAGRLVLVDHADPHIAAEPERPPSGLEHLRDEDYRGPLVFRLTLDPTLPLPRRADLIPPLFPRAWGGRAGGGLLPRLVAVAPVGDGLVVLSSSGALFRVTSDAGLVPFATLPHGQYLRINMVGAPDGGLFVSGGFTVAMLFRVSANGEVTTLAGPLGDPQGLALADGHLYVAESSLHRIVRLGVPGAR
jgi:hypothetical protein